MLWRRGSEARARGGLSPAWVGIGAVALLLGLLFVLWSARVAPHTLAPTPSPQALP